MSTAAARRPDPAADAERAVRVDLAAAYRLAAHYGLGEMIRNHLTARVPGARTAFLVKPKHMTFDEVTASALVRVGLDGEPLEAGGPEIDRAGAMIHGAGFRARPDVAALCHAHPPATMAVSALREGLLPLSQHALRFYGQLAYHDYGALALGEDEGAAIARSLGDKPAMILRHHGLLTVGRSVAEAFVRMYYLDLACRIQLDAQASHAPLALPPASVCETFARQMADEDVGGDEWPALLRLAVRLDPGFRA